MARRGEQEDRAVVGQVEAPPQRPALVGARRRVKAGAVHRRVEELHLRPGDPVVHRELVLHRPRVRDDDVGARVERRSRAIFQRSMRSPGACPWPPGNRGASAADGDVGVPGRLHEISGASARRRLSAPIRRSKTWSRSQCGAPVIRTRTGSTQRTSGIRTSNSRAMKVGRRPCTCRPAHERDRVALEPAAGLDAWCDRPSRASAAGARRRRPSARAQPFGGLGTRPIR